MPINTNVRVNWWSIHGAEVETPRGSHQVFAAKKYVLKNVISQISTRIAKPIYQTSRGRGFAHRSPKQTCGWPKSLSHSRLTISNCRLALGARCQKWQRELCVVMQFRFSPSPLLDSSRSPRTFTAWGERSRATHQIAA